LSKDPIESASKGATEAFLDWTEEKAKNAAKQFLNRKLAFIKDSENIELVKSQTGSSEFALLSRFIPKGGSIGDTGRDGLGATPNSGRPV
jgi:hypothetical protein